MRQAERYDGERKKVLKKLSSLEKEMDRLDRALQAFQHAERLAAGDVQNSKIHQLRERLEKIDSEIHYAKNQLDFYREQSAKKGQELQKLFDELVRRILKADYSGSITTSAVDFTPQIQQGSAIAGAAVESLSFLLMDITSMLAASRGIGHHPGFWCTTARVKLILILVPIIVFLPRWQHSLKRMVAKIAHLSNTSSLRQLSHLQS